MVFACRFWPCDTVDLAHFRPELLNEAVFCVFCPDWAFPDNPAISLNAISVFFFRARGDGKRAAPASNPLLRKAFEAALDDWLIDKSPGAAPIRTPHSSLSLALFQQNTTHTLTKQQHFALALFSFSLRFVPLVCAERQGNSVD